MLAQAFADRCLCPSSPTIEESHQAIGPDPLSEVSQYHRLLTGSRIGNFLENLNLLPLCNADSKELATRRGVRSPPTPRHVHCVNRTNGSSDVRRSIRSRR